MKKIFSYILALVCMCISTSCVAQGKVFKEVSKMEGVTAIYLSKAMCQLGTAGIGIDELGDGILRLDGMEMVTCDNEKSMDKVKSLIDKDIADSGAQLWVAMTETNNDVSIYAIPEGDGAIAKKLYLLTVDNNELQFIMMSGQFDLAKITNAFGDGKK